MLCENKIIIHEELKIKIIEHIGEVTVVSLNLISGFEFES